MPVLQQTTLTTKFWENYKYCHCLSFYLLTAPRRAHPPLSWARMAEVFRHWPWGECKFSLGLHLLLRSRSEGPRTALQTKINKINTLPHSPALNKRASFPVSPVNMPHPRLPPHPAFPRGDLHSFNEGSTRSDPSLQHQANPPPPPNYLGCY